MPVYKRRNVGVPSEVQVIGYDRNPVSFRSDNGVDITGVNVYVSYPDALTDGVRCTRLFIRSSVMEDGKVSLKVGLRLGLRFSAYGGIQSVKAV